MSLNNNNNGTQLNKPLLESNSEAHEERESSQKKLLASASGPRSEEASKNAQQLVPSAFAATPNAVYGGPGVQMQMQMQPMQQTPQAATTFVPAGNMLYLPNQQPVYGYSSIPYTNNSVNANQAMHMQMRVNMNSDAMADGVQNPVALGKQRAIYFTILLCCITCSVFFIVATVTNAIFSISASFPATKTTPPADAYFLMGYYNGCMSVTFKVRSQTISVNECRSTSDQLSDASVSDDIRQGIYGSQAAAIMSIVFAGSAGLIFALLPLRQSKTRLILLIFTSVLVLAIGSAITALALFIQKRSEGAPSSPVLEYGGVITIIGGIGQLLMVFLSIILLWKKVTFDHAVWPCAPNYRQLLG